MNPLVSNRGVIPLLRGHFWPSLKLFLRLAWRNAALRKHDGRLCVRRIGVMALYLPLFASVQAWHWFGFLLDELFFGRYRRVRIREPLFVVGPPRSGTTLLHRTLALDTERFATFSTWETLFALSITARRLCQGMRRLDRCVGRPMARLLNRVQRFAFKDLEGIHDMSLDAPEEDYLSLCPILACFLLVMPFPRSVELWRLSRFDDELSPQDKTRIMSFYRLCLQKHLYVHGVHKRLLSKNAAFSPAVRTLRMWFPDCRIVCCMRDPSEAVPSLLNAVQSGAHLFDLRSVDPSFERRMVDAMAHYYRHLLGTLPRLDPESCTFVHTDELKAELPACVLRIYQRFGYDPEPAFHARLANAGVDARRYRSRSRYSLTDYDLDQRRLRRCFESFYAWREREARATPGRRARHRRPQRDGTLHAS